jgi:hypothetical protein
MKNTSQLIRSFAAVTAIWLTINLIMVPFNWEAVFHDTLVLSGAEIFMFIGMLLIFLFNVAVIVWVSSRKLQGSAKASQYNYLFTGAVLCFFVLFAAKVMAAEIGWESLMGWDFSVKYLLFNILLCLQILYNIYFIFTSRKLELGKLNSLPE